MTTAGDINNKKQKQRLFCDKQKMQTTQPSHLAISGSRISDNIPSAPYNVPKLLKL